MKKIIKSFYFVLILGMFFMFTACSDNDAGSDKVNDTEKTSDKSIYEHGLDLIILMEEMAESEDYLDLMMGNPEINEIVSVVGDWDYTKPKAVYQISFSDETYTTMIDLADVQGLSDTLKDYVISKTQNSVANMINARGGTKILVAASSCMAGKCFVSNEITEDVMYIYTYDNAIPVIITFAVGEDGAVSASGSFIFYEDFKADTAQDIEQSLGLIGVNVEEIKR